MKKLISLLAGLFSFLTFLISLLFFIQYVSRDPQYVLNTIFDKGFYWRLSILILSFFACLLNLFSLVVKKERLFKTAEERKKVSKTRLNDKILHLNAKIEKLKNWDDRYL